MTEVQHLRRALETTIEMLIAYLDEIDGNPDLEETGDEHDQGVPEGWRKTYQPFEDAEDDDPAEDCGDAEPEDGI